MNNVDNNKGGGALRPFFMAKNSVIARLKYCVAAIISFSKQPKKIILSILLAVIAGVFIDKGHKITAWLGGITATFSALSLPEWGIVVGIFSSLVSMVAMIFFKWLNSSMLRKAIKEGKPVGHLFKSEGVDL